jgi:hypothetical protein
MQTMLDSQAQKSGMFRMLDVLAKPIGSAWCRSIPCHVGVSEHEIGIDTHEVLMYLSTLSRDSWMYILYAVMPLVILNDRVTCRLAIIRLNHRCRKASTMLVAC